MSSLSSEFIAGYHHALVTEYAHLREAVVRRLVTEQRLRNIERLFTALDQCSFVTRLCWVASGRLPR